MMAPDENEPEEGLQGVPSDLFDGRNSPVSALGGWASAGAGVGNALFAVTKGVSSRVEGVSARMTLRAKDILSSMGEDDRKAGDGRGGGGEMNGTKAAHTIPNAVDEAEILRVAHTLGAPVQLAEKVIAMNKLSSDLGDSGTSRKTAPRGILKAVADPLVLLMGDSEHLDPFFANACVGCALKLVEGQGEDFAADLIEAGAAEALIPLLNPRFELVRIETLVLVKTLLQADRAEVCSRVVRFPRGMQALVDLLDDRLDEVRHEGVSLLAAFLGVDAGTSPPVDLQNFVAFQEGFERLFHLVQQPSESTAHVALAALRGAVVDNPVSRKFFVAGGHLSRLVPLLTLDHMQTVDLSALTSTRPRGAAGEKGSRLGSSSQKDGRRRWSWGGGGDGPKRENGAGTGRQDGNGPVEGGGDQGSVPVSNGASRPQPSKEGGKPNGNGVPAVATQQERPGASEASEASDASEEAFPEARIRAALGLVLALFDSPATADPSSSLQKDDGGDPSSSVEAFASGQSGTEAKSVSAVSEASKLRGAAGHEGGLIEAICELALGSTRAQAGKAGPSWADYGMPSECQHLAMEALAAVVWGHAENQARLAACDIRGPPIAVSVQGRTELVRGKPRAALDSLFAMWLAVSSLVEAEVDTEEAAPESEGSAGKEKQAAREMALLDRLLDAFLAGNVSWCRSVLAGVSALHGSSASVHPGGAVAALAAANTPTPSPRAPRREHRGRGGRGAQRGSVGVAILSDVISTALLSSAPHTRGGVAQRAGMGREREPSSPSPRTGPSASLKRSDSQRATGDGKSDDPLTAAISVRLLRRVLQAGGHDSRSVAAAIGIFTEGAGRREERLRRAQAMSEPAATDESVADEDDYLLPLSAGDGFSGEVKAWNGPGEGSTRLDASEVEGARKCAPPLTPALEVAVRLFADGYNVAVMVQEGIMEGGGEGSASLPLDLIRYLITLGEVLVAWLSPPGVGSAISNRLLASGANWALLRTFGRVLAISSEQGQGDAGAVKSPCRDKGGGGRRSPPAFARDYSFAYLHALVAVTLGSFFSSGDGLTRRTLSAGISKHVGLFPFCRALDAASDWVAFARQMGGQNGMPSYWALAGDPAFAATMLSATTNAQLAVIDGVAGNPQAARPSAQKKNGTSHPNPSNGQNLEEGDAAKGGAASASTGEGKDSSQKESSEKGVNGGNNGTASLDSEARPVEACRVCSCGDLLRRQEVRILELERRLRERDYSRYPRSPARSVTPNTSPYRKFVQGRSSLEGAAKVTPKSRPRDSPLDGVDGATLEMTI